MAATSCGPLPTHERLILFPSFAPLRLRYSVSCLARAIALVRSARGYVLPPAQFTSHYTPRRMEKRRVVCVWSFRFSFELPPRTAFTVMICQSNGTQYHPMLRIIWTPSACDRNIATRTRVEKPNQTKPLAGEKKNHFHRIHINCHRGRTEAKAAP